MFFRSYLLCQLLIARRFAGRHSILAATASESIRSHLGRGFRSVCLIALILTRQMLACSPQIDSLSRAKSGESEGDHFNRYVASNRFPFANILPFAEQIVVPYRRWRSIDRASFKTRVRLKRLFNASLLAFRWAGTELGRLSAFYDGNFVYLFPVKLSGIRLRRPALLIEYEQ